MPRGASQKREREYKKLVKEFKEEDRYDGREEEVAARIVNKQRKEHGETKSAKRDDRHGESEDRDLPIEHYDHLTAKTIIGKLDHLSSAEIKTIRKYEKAHGERVTILDEIDRLLH